MNRPDELSEILSCWQTTPSAQADFAASVRSRLAETAPPGVLARIIQFPATLPLAAGFAVMIGVSMALTSNRTAHRNDQAEAYLQSIDPIRMTAHANH